MYLPAAILVCLCLVSEAFPYSNRFERPSLGSRYPPRYRSNAYNRGRGLMGSEQPRRPQSPNAPLPMKQGQPASQPMQQMQSAPQPMQARPAPRTVRPQPARRPVRPQAAPQAMQSQPAPRPVRPQPARRPVRPQPAPQPMQAQPASQSMRPQSAPRPMQAQPAFQSMQAQQPAFQSMRVQQPAFQSMRAQPAPQPMQARQPAFLSMRVQPAPQSMQPQPALQSVQAQPAPQPMQAQQPVFQPMQPQPAFQSMQSQPTPQPMQPQPAPQPIQAQPASIPVQQPEPQIIYLDQSGHAMDPLVDSSGLMTSDLTQHSSQNTPVHENTFIIIQHGNHASAAKSPVSSQTQLKKYVASTSSKQAPAPASVAASYNKPQASKRTRTNPTLSPYAKYRRQEFINELELPPTILKKMKARGQTHLNMNDPAVASHIFEALDLPMMRSPAIAAQFASTLDFLGASGTSAPAQGTPNAASGTNSQPPIAPDAPLFDPFLSLEAMAAAQFAPGLDFLGGPGESAPAQGTPNAASGTNSQPPIAPDAPLFDPFLSMEAMAAAQFAPAQGTASGANSQSTAGVASPLDALFPYPMAEMMELPMMPSLI